MTHVAILQEYLPRYRVPFFRELASRCEEIGIHLTLHTGRPNQEQARRRDIADDPVSISVETLRQREIEVLNRRLVWRQLTPAIRRSDLLIIEQARRNVDVYRLLLPRHLWPASSIAMWGHGRDYVQRRSHLESRLFELLTRRVDHFFAYTDAGAEHVMNLGVNDERITVVRNSVDTRHFRLDLSDIGDAELHEFKASQDLSHKTLLYVGGLDVSKRIEFLLDAFDIARAQDSKLRLIIAGDGCQRALVQERAASTPGIVYLGRSEGRTKALAFRSSSCLAIPGRVGLVAVESITSGIPIVTTDWPFHAPEFDYLTPGATTFTSGDSPLSYARLLLSVVNDSDLLGRAREQLFSLAPSLSIETMADNFLVGIRSALSRTADRG